MLKNKTSLVKFDHCIMVSLRTFQPTLVLCIVVCSVHFEKKFFDSRPFFKVHICHGTLAPLVVPVVTMN